MAFSADEGKQFFKEWLWYMAHPPKPIKTILDVGAGAGTYGRIIRTVDKPFVVHAVEPYETYVERHQLKNFYDKVYTEKIADMLAKDKLACYDLIILGDVLEHMGKIEALALWNKLKPMARFLWLSLPVEPFRDWFWGYRQPAADYEENILERHLYDWGYTETLVELGPFLWQVPFRTVAVFIAEGEWGGGAA